MSGALPFFGLNGATGDYLHTAESHEVAELALREEVGASHVSDLHARLEHKRPSLGVVDAVGDVTDLAQTGWAVVFPSQVARAIKDALRDLLYLRRAQASRCDTAYYQEYEYYPGETKRSFLRRLHVAPSGGADPEQMPYYVLLVGDPETIPFSFQYQLDVQYAVGRIHFDTVDEYTRYAQSVVAEEARSAPGRRTCLFGVKNPDDAPTTLSTTRLVAPLAERIRARQAKELNGSRWRVESVIGDQADKARLASVLGGRETPDLLFTASHGVGFPSDDPRQREYQGALVCQDWPGPAEWRGELRPDFYFAADDLPADAHVLGLIAVHFACFGAGTPRLDDYPQLISGASTRLSPLGLRMARPIAGHAFVSRLAQRLLSHPNGSALAVVGHVERALGASLWDSYGKATNRPGAFDDLMGRLMRGVPVGAALEPFNECYAELCADLTSEIREIEQAGKIPDTTELARLWTGSVDARGYAIFGDPAVRLAISAEPVSLDEANSGMREASCIKIQG